MDKLLLLGQMSVSDIARQLGCVKSTVSKRLKKKGIEREGVEVVKVRTKEKLKKVQETETKKKLKPFVAPDNEPVTPLTDKDIDLAAESNLLLLLAHRKDIKKLREQEQRLLKALGLDPKKDVTASYKGAISKKSIKLSVAEQAQALQALANVMRTRQDLERRAVGLDDKSDDNKEKNDIKDVLSWLDGRSKGLPTYKQEELEAKQLEEQATPSDAQATLSTANTATQDNKPSLNSHGSNNPVPLHSTSQAESNVPALPVTVAAPPPEQHTISPTNTAPDPRQYNIEMFCTSSVLPDTPTESGESESESSSWRCADEEEERGVERSVSDEEKRCVESSQGGEPKAESHHNYNREPDLDI